MLWVLIRLMRNARICNARSGKVGSSHCYLNRQPLHEIDELVYEYDIKQFNRMLLSHVTVVDSDSSDSSRLYPNERSL